MTIRSRRSVLICIAIAVVAVVRYMQWHWPNAVAQALLEDSGMPMGFASVPAGESRSESPGPRGAQ